MPLTLKIAAVSSGSVMGGMADEVLERPLDREGEHAGSQHQSQVAAALGQGDQAQDREAGGHEPAGAEAR